MVLQVKRARMRITIRMWILVIALILALLMISPSFESGVVIKSVTKNSTEFENGLRNGMKIKQINGEAIKSIEQFHDALDRALEGKTEARMSFATDKGEFIFYTSNKDSIQVEKIARTKIKTGLDLSGGARALIAPENVSLSSGEISDLVAITSNRLNVFGLTDLTVKPVKDLSGNNYMLIEIAGATPSDLEQLVGQQGKFEAKIANQTVFIGGEKDISDVCRNDASCAGIQSCSPSSEGGYFCNFAFTVYLTEEAAKRHADITGKISVDETGKYLSEKLYLYVDGTEVDSLMVSENLKGKVTTQISVQGSGGGNNQEEAFNKAKEEMNKLQTILLTGSLPYKLNIVKLDSISPFLGEEFTKALIYLALIVFLIISVVLFIVYRNIKITSAVILTMFSEVFITLGIAALIRWNLDAPGIAGIIAGMGTGVNDQIVILSESESGGNESLKERIKRALFIIVGAFFTIIAAMMPLFWAGAGMLRGFALTTIIGVSVGILITRPAFADIVKKIKGE
jgi:preprotein translocase subunit SecD